MKNVSKSMFILLFVSLSQCASFYIENFPMYADYAEIFCLVGPTADRGATRVYCMEAMYKTKLVYGFGDTTIPVIGRKIRMSCTGSSGGSKYYCYIKCYNLPEYTQDIKNYLYFNYSNIENGVNNVQRTNNNGELWFYVGFGDKNYSWLPYYPNALKNHPELPEIVALPDIPYDPQNMLWFSALALSAYVIQGASVVQSPAHLVAVLQGDIYKPYSGWSHCWGLRGKGPMPEMYIDSMGLDVEAISPPQFQYSLDDYIPEESYSTLPPRINIDYNSILLGGLSEQSLIEEIPRCNKQPAKDYTRYSSVNGFHILKDNSYWHPLNKFIVHNLADINTPQDCNNYLESNWPYAYIETIEIANPSQYNSNGFTTIIKSIDSNGKCLTKMPIFMAVKSKQENSITFISDYFYAMNDCYSQGVFYDNQSNQYVCIPVIRDGNLAVSQIAIEEYGDFNFDGIVNSKDFAIFAEKLKLTTQDEKYDMMFDYDKDNKIDNKDLFLFVKSWLKHSNKADFNIDGKINLIDYSMLCHNFGDVNPLYDLNKNGKIDIEDLKIFKENYLYGESK